MFLKNHLQAEYKAVYIIQCHKMDVHFMSLYYTVCPTRYQTRHFFNNFTTNKDKFSNYTVCTHMYTNTHEQHPYCVGTLSQMTERLAERRVRQETGWLAGGPLLRVATVRRTADTSHFISHTTNLLLFKFRCNIFFCVRIIK